MCRHAGIPHNDMIALIVDAAIQRLKKRYPGRFDGKIAVLEELSAAAFAKAAKKGVITHQDCVYNLLGN